MSTAGTPEDSGMENCMRKAGVWCAECRSQRLERHRTENLSTASEHTP